MCAHGNNPLLKAKAGSAIKRAIALDADFAIHVADSDINMKLRMLARNE
jgi:hypothetical protein